MATQNKNFRVKNGIDAEGTITATALATTGGTASQFLKANGSIDSSTYLTTTTASSTYAALAGATFTGQIQSTLANNAATGGGQIYLNGATGNRIDFNVNGIAAPAFTTRSAGTKIVLYPVVGASSADYAIGIENSTLWNSVGTTSNSFKWYGGTTLAATLTGAGALSTTSTISASGLAGSLLNTTTVGATLGTAATGTLTIPARADHVHPTTGLGLTASGLNQFAATTSAQLAGVISDETGSGALVFGTSPTITTLLTVSGAALGGTAGNETIVESIDTTTANADRIRTKYRRISTGSNWETAQAKIQRVIDASDVGYIGFGGTGVHDVRLGSGTTDIAVFAPTSITFNQSVSGTSLSLSTALTATNGGTAQATYTTGDILYASASNTLSKRTIGSTGQVLVVSGGVPTWGSVSASGTPIADPTEPASPVDGQIWVDTDAASTIATDDFAIMMLMGAF